MAINTIAAPPIIYPERDGKPLGETDWHRQEILDTIAALSEHFRFDPAIYVSGNLMFYYEEGKPAAVTSPDVFVVKGVAKGARRIYKLWEEGRAPCLVIEVSSRSTRRDDLGKKKQLYATLGVDEYVLFDPLDEYLKPPLQGFRLDHGTYVAMQTDAEGALFIATLNLRALHQGSNLLLFDATSGERLLRPAEMAEARRAEEAARQAAELARRTEEAARQAAELARRAEEAARQAAEERAATLETELERLRAELQRVRGTDQE